MKRAIALFLVMFCNSCQYLEKKVPSEKELFDKQMQEINWKEVDEYPSVMYCDTIKNEEQRKQCFFDFLTSSIQQKIAIDTLSEMFPQLDTMEVRVTIFPNSSIAFEPLFPKDSVKYDTIKIDSILRTRLVDFPRINPALKRGIPVKTQFILPVIVKLE